jgi:LPS sulfotransferase NodH
VKHPFPGVQFERELDWTIVQIDEAAVVAQSDVLDIDQGGRKTGLPRRPREYFEDAETPEIVSILGGYTRIDDELTLYDPRRFSAYRDYLDWTIAQATTSNGVFGAKVMWGYFNGFVDGLRDVLGNAVLPTRTVLERSFPNLDSWIFMTRDDKLRQAISLWKAIQNWTWKRDHGAGAVITHDLRYSFDAIDHLQRQLQHEEREWRAYGTTHTRAASEQQCRRFRARLR